MNENNTISNCVYCRRGYCSRHLSLKGKGYVSQPALPASNSYSGSSLFLPDPPLSGPHPGPAEGGGTAAAGKPESESDAAKMEAANMLVLTQNRAGLLHSCFEFL